MKNEAFKACFVALGVAVVVAATMTPADALAAPQSVAEIATYSGADRQAVLEAGAKKEGSILIFTTGTQTQPIMDAFSAKYPFIRVEVFRSETADLVRKMVEEYKAGRYTVDCPDLSIEGLFHLRDLGHLQPFFSPELAAMRAEAIEPKKLWANDYESYIGLGYNTKLIPEAEAPKTYDNLLDSKWKGKMAVGANVQSFGNFTGAIVLDKGEDFVRKLGQQQFRVFEMTGRAVANLVVSGEVPLSPSIYNSHMANSQDQGANVAWRALGGVFVQSGAISIAAKAPHPHATMLFIDFNLSREGQSMRQKLGYASARTDLQNREKPSKLHYTMLRPTYEQDFEKWLALARQTFGKGSAPGK
jgi:iron(III) transport system substrate-binding protein